MIKLFIPVSVLLVILVSCGSSENTQDTDGNERIDNNISSEVEIIDLEENPIMVEVKGVAANRKGGAVIISNDNGEHYWIDGLDYWEDKYLDQQIVVVGEFQTRNDAPVFLDTGVIKSQGIPVYTEEALESNQSRVWIINAEYKLINE